MRAVLIQITHIIRFIEYDFQNPDQADPASILNRVNTLLPYGTYVVRCVDSRTVEE